MLYYSGLAQKQIFDIVSCTAGDEIMSIFGRAILQSKRKL
jgi:hypothetical protein